MIAKGIKYSRQFIFAMIYYFKFIIVIDLILLLIDLFHLLFLYLPIIIIVVNFFNYGLNLNNFLIIFHEKDSLKMD